MTLPINAGEFIGQIRVLANELIAALDSGDTARIQKDQAAFSAAIERAWAAFNRPEVPAREKAIPRLIESWAQRDLLTEVNDPANRQKAVHDLKLFLNTLALFE
jgi:hypothetical protein